MEGLNTEKITKDFRVLMDDAEELLKATANQVDERISVLRQRLEKKIQDGRDALSERRRSWSRKADEFGAARANCSSSKALLVPVGIAIGIGALIALMRRRD